MEYRSRLHEFNPAGCLMSGSGSNLFALCRDKADAERIVQGWETRNAEQRLNRGYFST